MEREGCRRDGIWGQVGRALPGQEARGTSPWAECSPLAQVPWPRLLGSRRKGHLRRAEEELGVGYRSPAVGGGG